MPMMVTTANSSTRVKPLAALPKFKERKRFFMAGLSGLMEVSAPESAQRASGARFAGSRRRPVDTTAREGRNEDKRLSVQAAGGLRGRGDDAGRVIRDGGDVFGRGRAARGGVAHARKIRGRSRAAAGRSHERCVIGI